MYELPAVPPGQWRFGQSVPRGREGRVNVNHTYIRYKWGVSRLVDDIWTLTVVIPVFVISKETVLPTPDWGKGRLS